MLVRKATVLIIIWGLAGDLLSVFILNHDVFKSFTLASLIVIVALLFCILETMQKGQK